MNNAEVVMFSLILDKDINYNYRPYGPTEIGVQWTTNASISDQVTSYVISWDGVGGENGKHSVDSTSSNYTISDLVPCTIYTITVQPTATNSIPLGDPGLTRATTATQGVLPVATVTPTTVTDNSHSLKVSWTLFVDIGRCPGYYKVTWNVSQNGEKEIQNTNSYTITDLDTWTTYNVCVDSGNDADSLYNSTQCGDGKTDEDVPGSPPTNITTTNVTADSLTVQWGPPDIPNGNIINYMVSWSPDNGTYDTNEIPYTILDLLPCSYYTVTVSAATSKGNGIPGETSDFTQPAVPGPPNDLNVNMVPNESHKLGVTWVKPKTRCTPLTYTVTWNLNETGDLVDTVTLNASGLNENYIITELQPYTTYDVCVKATTDMGDSSVVCKTQTTDEDKPGGPPLYVTVSGAPTNDSMTIQWNPPAVPNGIIINYEVTWSPDEGKHNTSDTTYTLTGLQPCTNYTIEVRAATSKGSGPPGNIFENTPPMAPGPVSNALVNMVVNQSDTLDVTWTQAEAFGRCVITSNTVSWTLGDTGVLVDSVLLEPTEKYTITGLDPWTIYLVCVRATTQGENGPDGQCQKETTDEDKPGPPSTTTATALSPSSIKVSWEPPKIPNGIITEYLIEWNLDNGNVSDVTVSGTTTEYNVTDLIECTFYDFSVTASTKKGLGETHGTASSITETKKPPPPGQVVCTATEATVLRVTWYPPVTKCDVAQYNVDYHGEVLWSNDIDPGQPASSKNTLIDLTHLVPWTHYSVCVEAEIIGGLVGNQSCCESTTEQSAPGPPTYLNQTGANTKSVKVAWTPPEVLNGNLTGYYLSWELGNKQLSKEERHTTVGGLKAGIRYNLTLQAVTAGIHMGEGKQLYASTNKGYTGIIIGSTVGVLLIVAVTVFLFINRDNVKKKMRKLAASRQDSNNDRRMESTNSTTPDGLVLRESSEGFSRTVASHPPVPPKPRGLEVRLQSNWLRGEVNRNEIRQYIQYLEKDSQRGLEEEYARLKEQSPQHSSDIASMEINLIKNRFINILPFDHTRVKVPVESTDAGSNYINASYISDTQNGDYFVATQGPKPISVSDFWRMVWELKVYTIVMLTNLRENGKNKCAEYWPAPGDQPLRSGNVTIINQTEEVGDDHVVRYLVINVGEKKRLVKQYHFTSWPDFGVPSHEHKLLQFLKVVRDTMTCTGKHIVIHCSAGVGRTGTFIGLWNLMDLLKANTSTSIVNVRRTILDMRECRPSMVQSQDQYLYLWKCVAAYLEEPQRWKPKTRNTSDFFKCMITAYYPLPGIIDTGI
ncbi:hypothetical protein Pmani_013386 [Petrolisthes manimaculis]|uniref:Protein-tyrosine-phosphatase n=1 Tax=Petrolisthes manimaculis TaxID=1843537 RepID=A0AAE1UCA2_9EUCA|nr:hypothetical protein Pmani_013386 [Petrolisthes manimaculis]